MTPSSLQHELETATSRLIDLVRELTWNKISNNCKFILSEIINGNKNFFEKQQSTKKGERQKIPVTLQDTILILQKLYDNLYDINLYIYRAKKKITVIDIRYYPKSALDEGHRQSVIDKAPMLHCTVSMPPSLDDKKEKFDINWEHKKAVYWWKMFWLQQKFKSKGQLTRKY